MVHCGNTRHITPDNPPPVVVEAAAKAAIHRMSKDRIGRGEYIGYESVNLFLNLPPIDPSKYCISKKYGFGRKFLIELIYKHEWDKLRPK